jgi:hypothetical protein
MILVIEDNEGRAWVVKEEVDNLDLSVESGKQELLSAVEETVNQIREETDEYERESLSPEDEIDLQYDANLPDNEERVKCPIGYSELEDDDVESELNF